MKEERPSPMVIQMEGWDWVCIPCSAVELRALQAKLVGLTRQPVRVVKPKGVGAGKLHVAGGAP